MDIVGLIQINDWFLLFLGLVFAFYLWSTWRFDYWTKQGVPGPKPLPFLLNYIYLFTEGLKWDSRLMKEYGKTVGAFEGRIPYLISTDDDILREVFVKQFPNFSHRRIQTFPPETGLDKSVVILTEEQGWKRVRDLMSPTFSSGKLKQLSGRINDCSKFYIKTFDDLPIDGKEINVKESLAKVAMSLIGGVAFGIDTNNKEIYDEFSGMGKRMMDNQSGVKLALGVLNFLAPTLTQWVTKILKIEMVDVGPFRYFGKIVDQILDSRTKGDKATDFIQLMANAHKDHENMDKQKEGMTREEIVSNGVTFFMAGFDTVSSGLSVLLYHLAMNPDAQDRVYKEVAAILDKKDQIEYEDLQELTYLDWCFSEALRMIPPAVKTERQAKEAITIKGIHIEKDMTVGIPILHLHFDEKRWDNPHVFRPERFSNEESKDRSPFSWMPFGYGPRNCIGMRLALVEMKIVAAHLLYNFTYQTCSKTKIPFEATKFGAIKEGLEMKITRRLKQ